MHCLLAGEPYQYVGGSDNTVAWDHAPTAVVGARELILERMKQSLGLNGAFNEVLSAAYIEKQRMAVCSVIIIVGFRMLLNIPLVS